MAVIYLDVDDEITSVAARVRRIPDARIALVVPAGSRIGTSRINFRLLAREGAGHSRALAIVTPDAAARAVAVAAGLDAYATVAEYEQAEAARGGPDPAIAAEMATGAAAGSAAAGSAAAFAAAGSAAGVRGGAPARGSGTSPDPSAATAGVAGPASSLPRSTAPVAGRSGPGGVPLSTGLAPARPARSASRPRGRRRWPWIAAIVVVAALVGGSAAAWTTLPTATVTIHPAVEPLGPMAGTVRADPTVASVDVDASVVPATRVEVPVQVSDRFDATGKKVTQTKATGAVTFLSKDPTRANTIPAGSVVRTAAGVAFSTRASVTVPKARIEGLTILPGTAQVQVTAVKGGPEANVAPNTISIVPAGEDPVLLEVRNRAVTTGGTRESTPLVTQKDVDAALKTLGSRLDTRFADAAADPARAPEGAVLVPGTELMGSPVPTPDPATLVGQQVDAFDLTLAATGAITAYAPAAVRAVALAQLLASAPAGTSIVDGSASVEAGDAVATGESAEIPTTATASVIRTIDPAAIRALVRGRSPAEARAALAAYGDVTVVVWPAFVPSITGADARIDVVIVPADGSVRPPAASATPAPAASAIAPSGAP